MIKLLNQLANFYCLIILLYLCQVQSYSSIEKQKPIEGIENGLTSPSPKDHAKVARSLVHKSKWASVGTISTDEAIQGFPMVNIISIADGIENGKSTGVIYFLSTTLDFTGKDLMVHNKTTLMISDDQDLHCSKEQTDPMEPTCPRVHISGNVVKMEENFPDYNRGFESLIRIHPAAKNWIKAHHFSLCKINIKNIYVLDYYGGPKTVTAEQYYAAVPGHDLTQLSKGAARDKPKYFDFYSKKSKVININLNKNMVKKININF